MRPPGSQVGLSNQFANIDLNSGSESHGGPPSNMPPLPVDPMKFSNIAPPVSSGVNFYGNNSSTLKQTSNFPPTSEPNSLLSYASAPSPLPSNLLGHHQQNLNAYLPPNQQNQSGKSSPNTAFGPNTTGPLNQFPPAQSNQNEAQSKPPSQEPLGDFQQQSARKSASPQQPGPNDNHDNGLNTSDPSPPVQRPPQSFTPNPNTQRPPSVHQEPDGAPAPNVQSPNTFSSSAFKPSTGGPFQPLKPSQPSSPPQQGDTSPSSIKSPGPQRNFPSGPQGFQPSQPGGENSFLQSPSQPQQSQSFSSPPKSEALPPSNSGGFAQMGSGDPASYPNQVSTPGPSFSSPPGAITSSSMSFTPSSGPSQGVSSPGFPTSAGNVQSPQQPPQSSQAGTQPPSGGLNGLPSGLRSSPLTGPPSGLSGPPLNGPPSFGGPQFNSPPSSLGGPNVGSPPQNRPPSSFGGPQSPPSSLVGPLQNGPPSTFGGPPQNRPPSSFGGPQISSPSSSLGGPPQNLGGPLQNGPPSSFGGPPQSGPPSTFGSPPQNRPPSSFGAPQMNNPSSSLGGPAQNLGGPLQNGPPSSFGGPPQNRPPSSFGGPQISSPSSSFGGPAQNLGGPLQNGPPSSFGGPSSRPPSSFSGPPSGLGGPTLSGPPSSLGGPSTFGGAPQSGPPSSFPGPSSGLGGPPSGLGGPPSGLGGPSSGLGGPPAGLGGPPSGLGGPPSGLGGPPSGLGGPAQNGPPTGLGAPPSSSLSGPLLSGPGVGGSRPNLGRPQYARPPPQQTYPQSGFPSQPGQQPGFPPQPTGQQQPGFPPQPTGQSGFPPQPSGLQQPGFPPQPQSQSGFPPQPSAQPGFPPQPSGQPGFPPSQGPGQGFPQQNFPQQPGFPPMPSQQKFPPQQSPPGFPPQPGSGYPQQPGYPQGPGGYQQQQQEFSPPGMQYPNTRPQPTAQKKLDPDNMPSRIQVMQDDRKGRSGEFRTDQRGGLPPLVTTPFTVQDQGNCSPRFVRSTMYSVPTTADLMKQVSVPFGLVISEMEPPEADFSQSGGPVRCGRCKAYMAPFMQFVDGGRRFHCPMCKATTDVPETYFAHMDALGQRMDKYQRPELCLGSYELIVSEQYCRDSKFPNPPALIFILDVSYSNVKSGLVQLLCSRMAEILAELTNERLRVGFITYASSVHFYNIKASLVKPELLEMADIYRFCELDTLMNFFAKQCATKITDTTPRALRDALVTKTATILSTYRKNCASPGSSLGQLILPECLKLLPLYVNSLLRCDALSGGPEISLDDRSFALYSATIMDIPSSVVYLYPHLISLHVIDPNSDEMPVQERCSFEKLQPDGAYLLDNSIYMFLWVGQSVNNQWVESVFGVPSPAHIDPDRPGLPELDNALNRRVHDVIDHVRSTRPRSMRLTVVRQKDKLEVVLRQFLIEDRGHTELQMSYVDFLCHIHKEIRNQLS
ncbi:hypothetical protein M8J76_008238 [Diaphorina citri]|nr:hypothetical protein M8J76_008238 [Diaphorina citri]